jgi:hypothetical protein
LKKNGYSEGKTVLVLDVFSKAMNGLMMGMVVVIERVQAGAITYLTEPMARSVLVIRTKRALDAGIVDEQLRKRVVLFYQDCFLPTVRKIEEKEGGGVEDLWPGSMEIVAAYTSEEKEVWDTLEQELLVMLDQKDRVFSRAFEYFNGYEDKKDANKKALEALFRQEFLTHGDQYAFKSWHMRKQQVVLQVDQEKDIQRGVRFSEYVLENSAHVQGLLLFYEYSLFPIVLCVCMFSRSAGVLGVYVLLLVLTHGMTVMWALMDQVARVLFDITGNKGVTLPWEMGQINECVAWGMIVLPILTSLTAIVGMKRRKKDQQEGEK